MYKNDFKKLAKYLYKTYRSNNQRLHLHSETVEPTGKDRAYTCQEIWVKNPAIFDNKLDRLSKQTKVPMAELKLCAEEAGLVEKGYYDKYLFDIRTLDELVGYDLSSVPYFMVEEGIPIFTVKKFGQLTDDDMFFAIEYFIKFVRQISQKFLMIFNIYYNDRQVDVGYKKLYPSYRKDTDNLQYRKHREELIKENKK